VVDKNGGHRAARCERGGFTGGPTFQVRVPPDQMGTRRFDSEDARAGHYLCGAATHPGGSVIAANGRNAAMAVIEDGPVSP